MDLQQVDKNIRQMRSMFGLFFILSLIGLLNLFNSDAFGSGVFSLILAFLFGNAFIRLGKRSENGYTYAKICSWIFVLGFPVLTFFGISYLKKLNDPLMKQALNGVGNE